MNKHRALLFLLVATLWATACSGGAEEEAGTPTTLLSPGSSTSTTPTTSETDPALAAKAKAATLQPADFPPGFEPQPEEPGQGLNIELLWTELTRCLGVTNPRSAATGTSSTFKRGLATQGRSTVEYTTEPSATALSAALTGPKAQDCLLAAFKADLDRSKPEGSTPGPVKVTPRDVPAAGQKVLAWRINASVNLDELVVPLFQDFIVVLDGDTVVRMFFLNPGSEFPQELERTLVDKVVTRADVNP